MKPKRFTIIGYLLGSQESTKMGSGTLSANNLDLLIANNKVDEAISLIERIGEAKDISYLSNLYWHLEHTDSNILRNAIAITLADIGDNKSVKPLLNMLVHPKTIGSRGTLLYALEHIDYTSHALEITTLLVEGNTRESCRLVLLNALQKKNSVLYQEALDLLE